MTILLPVLQANPLRVATVCAAVVATTPSAHAQGLRNVQLDYEAPAGCGSKAAVLEKLSTALGDSEPLPEIAARVVVKGEPERYILDFRATKDGVESRRRLLVDTCEAATEAGALLLLLTLDPLLADRLGASEIVEQKETEGPPPEPEDKTAPEPTPAEDVKAPESEPTAAQTPPSPSESRAVDVPLVEGGDWVRGGWIGAGPTLITGMTPSAAYGGTLRGGFELGRLQVAVAGAYLVAPEAPIPAIEGAGVRSTMARASVRGEPRFGTGWWHFGPAVGLSLEYVAATSVDITSSGAGATQWLSGQVGVWSTAMISESWGLRLDAGATFPFERPRYRIVGVQEPVHRPAWVGVEAFVGAFWAWGSQF